MRQAVRVRMLSRFVGREDEIRQLEALIDEHRLVTISGRARRAGSGAERAHSAVTYRIRAAIRRLSDHDARLGRHLQNSVQTGTWCAYRPEQSVVWAVDPG